MTADLSFVHAKKSFYVFKILKYELFYLHAEIVCNIKIVSSWYNYLGKT